MSTYT